MPPASRGLLVALHGAPGTPLPSPSLGAAAVAPSKHATRALVSPGGPASGAVLPVTQPRPLGAGSTTGLRAMPRGVGVSPRRLLVFL